MMIDAFWSVGSTTSLGKLAKHIYGINGPVRRYHTWAHVERLYHHANHTFGFPYQAELDLAIMWHDAVYDSLPQKELRSADLWMSIYEAWWSSSRVPIDAKRVHTLIMATAYHEVTTDDPLEEQMILLDLADLMDHDQTAINYDLIEQESMLLYDIARPRAAEGTVWFMSGDHGLLKRIQRNRDRPGTMYREQWDAIIGGIEQTIRIARARL